MSDSGKKTNTISVCKILFERLSVKGLLVDDMLRFIGDILEIVGEGGNFTLTSMNQALEGLGWKEGFMDESIFGLIVLLLENEFGYGVKRHNLH